MLVRKWFGVTLASALLGVVAVSSNGCSSSSSNTNPGSTDAATESGPVRHPDSGGLAETGAGDDGSAPEAGTTVVDGTTGKKCATNADCKGTDPNAPGTNICSNTIGYTFTKVSFQIFPTPVCEIAPVQGGGNCDPCGGLTSGCDGNLHFCDGPDAPTSPGMCLPNNFANPMPGQGTCYPFCTLPADGSAPVGCAGNNRCVPFTWVLSTPVDGGAGTVTGYGFCQGACEKDADCTGLGAGWVCQTDIGFCTKAKVARTKTPGTGCTAGTATTSDNATGACYCIANSTTNLGYCSDSCIVGGLPCGSGSDAGANGYVCDSFIPSGPLTFGDAGTSPALTKQNTGLAGTCLNPCTAPDAGVGTDGGTQCPTNSMCQAGTLAGPDCLP
jgi:hypothetical protein